MTLQDQLLKPEWSVCGDGLLSALTNILFLQMGYANLEQIVAGIHQRIWSRAFILANTLNGPRIALVTLDILGASQIVKLEVWSFTTVAIATLFIHTV